MENSAQTNFSDLLIPKADDTTNTVEEATPTGAARLAEIAAQLDALNALFVAEKDAAMKAEEMAKKAAAQAEIKWKFLTAEVPEDLYNAVKQRSRNFRVSMRQIVIDALRAYL